MTGHPRPIDRTDFLRPILVCLAMLGAAPYGAAADPAPRNVTVARGATQAVSLAAGAHRFDDARRSVGVTDEEVLVAAIEDARAQRLDAAIGKLEALTARRPNFRLAQLVYADLLAARSRPLARFGDAARASSDSLAGLHDEARRRLRRHVSPPADGAVPAEILELSPNQRFAALIDLEGSRLYVFNNVDGVPRRLYDFYVSSGKNGAMKMREGDQKTPVGVYFTTGRVSPTTLPDFYGRGAIPINYPNEWDTRLGRTGYGIWIHGVPSDTYSRPPQASDGCMALSNDAVDALWPRFDGSEQPVVVARSIGWSDVATVARRRAEARERLETWRSDWQSLDHQRYMRHYSADFRGQNRDYRGWRAHKARVNAAKDWIKLEIEGVSVFAYPGEDDMLVLTFDQDYRSSNFVSQSRKRQYWRRESDGEWRIVFEGDARFSPVHYRGLPYSARARLTRATQ